MTAQSAPVVSVIVPFSDAERYLNQALSSLVNQSVNGGFEVVAVDNRSADRSRQIAESFVSRLPLTIVDADRARNPSYARNAGVAASRGHKLMFLDADDEIAADYLNALSTALDAHPFVTSRVDSVSLNPEWVREAHGAPWQAEGVSVFFDFLPATGVNVGIHRDVFERLGGFPEGFAACEDIAVSWSARIDLGLEPRFVADAVYRYRFRDSLRSLYAQGVGWGRGQVRLYDHFRSSGMPRRSTAAAVREWAELTRQLAGATNARECAAATVRLGCCAGRLRESLRRGVAFF